MRIILLLLLMVSCTEKPKDPRMDYYVGQCFYGKVDGNLSLAIKEVKKLGAVVHYCNGYKCKEGYIVFPNIKDHFYEGDC